MLWFWTAAAAEPWGVTTLVAWDAERGCTTDALVRISGALDQGGGADLHRQRVALARRTWLESSQAAETYEAWHAEAPDDLGLRVGLARALAAGDATSCERVGALLADRAATDDDRYAVARVLAEADACPELTGVGTAALRELAAAGHVASAGLVLGWDLRDRPTEAEATAAVEMLESRPELAPELVRSLSRAGSTAPRSARKAVLEAVEPWLTGDDPVRGWLAVVANEAAGQKVAEARARWTAEAPCVRPEPPEDRAPEPTATDELLEEVYAADRRPTHALALEGLDALAPRIPETGEVRATWQELRIDRLEALGGRDDDVYAARRDAAHALPDDPRAVNNWAWLAAERGVELEEALRALDRVLPPRVVRAGAVWDPTESGFADWSANERSWSAAWWDTRAWLLHRLGRHEEAARAITETLVQEADAELHLHAAEILLAIADDDRVYGHLVEVFSQPTAPSDAVATRAAELLRPRWEGRGGWHPAGFDGWIADRAPEPPAAPVDDEPPHPLVGEAFPLRDVQGLAGGRLALPDGEALLVVDVWATWCGPCVAAMPHLQEVAAAWKAKGVRVVGLSVDDHRGPAQRFYSGADVAYELGWIGAEGFEQLRLEGVPTMFLVGSDGTVLDTILGFGEGDRRLEVALAEHLDR